VSDPPERLGKYLVLGPIAQGGMATIYRAKSVGVAGFEKILALKRIHPKLTAEPRFIRSFIDEARIAVTLNHRNIVQVFDFGRAEGELFLAMEIIEGADLRTIVNLAHDREIEVPIAVACYVLADVAAGLDYAHKKVDAAGNSLGIVHCDVSPQNVMLSFEGFVKILDFGVARAKFVAGPDDKRLRGKPRYMAPEQTRGEPPTAAADVFALGTLCWELLADRPLFEGDSVAEVLRRVRQAAVPALAGIDPRVPLELSDAVARALRPAPAERGTAGELGLVLARTARELSEQASSRALAGWLESLYPRDPSVPRLQAIDDGAGTRTVILDEPPATQSTPLEVQPLEEEPATDPGALLERRRAVATALVLDGGTLAARRELVRMAAELAYKHGAVVHAQSDGAMTTLFGLEIAGEDDIASAMGFSLDAVELGREGAAADLDSAGLAVRVATRAGIVVRRVGAAFQVRAEPLAEAVALAREAEPGRPLLTGGTGRLASAQYEFRELPVRRHKSRRLRVLELIGRRSFVERGRALRDRRGRFVGRTVELELLGAALERALRGDGVVVAVLGGAGVGKSRLVAELVARASARPRPPAELAVAARPGARDVPFTLVTELCQSALDLRPARGEAARAELALGLRAAFDRAGMADQRDRRVAALEHAMSLRDGALIERTETPHGLREEVVGALAALRRALWGDRPVVAVIEDVHLADAVSAAVLGDLVAAPRAGELWLFTARREGDPGFLAAVEPIELDPLAAPERRTLIADRLGELATEEAIAAVERRAGGNPLFIEELAAAVHDLGGADIPASVRDVLRSRVDRLPTAVKATLQHAAVLGPVFRSALLEELLGPKVHDHLGELLAEGLIGRTDFAVADADEGELEFAGGFVQEVVYESLTSAARRQTHAQVGKLLALRHAAGRPEPPALVARHLELGGEPALAAIAWLRAGQVALAAADPTAAAHAFGRTLALDADQPGTGPRERRREAHEGRARARTALGDVLGAAQDAATSDDEPTR
jgi:serine/threonine protein kinase